MRLFKVLFFIVVVFLLIFFIQSLDKKDLDTKITIGDSEIKVELADTQEKRTLGLSGRKSLAENRGMFFIFNEVGNYSFWMKDMNFPIDIIWIGEDLKIVGLEKNILPESFPSLFFPPIPVKYVLETNINWTEENNVQVGDGVDKNF